VELDGKRLHSPVVDRELAAGVPPGRKEQQRATAALGEVTLGNLDAASREVGDHGERIAELTSLELREHTGELVHAVMMVQVRPARDGCHTGEVRPAALLAAVVLAAGAFAAGAFAAGASGSGALPNCAGKLQVKPSEVVFTCADAGFSAERLTWLAWGGKTAVAVGKASVNDCTPTCVAGHFHSYRIVLIASGSQRCPGGRTAYATVTYAFIGPSPFGPKDSRTTDPEYPYHCR
jgi:hypothetical protein